MIDSNSFNELVKEELAKAIEKQVETLFAHDAELLLLLKTQAVQTIVRKMDIEKNIEGIIRDQIVRQHEKAFNNTGIYNEATNRQLSVLEDVVVIEDSLVTRNVKVLDQAIVNNVSISGDLKVYGKVDLDTASWNGLSEKIMSDVALHVSNNLKEEMTAAVLAEADSIDHSQVLLDGKVALSGNQIGNQITHSNLRKVGQLENLTVKGEAKINDTLNVTNKRIGINTVSPTSALDLWDDEVEIVAGKHAAQTAFVGTARSQTLKLGVNNTGHLTIDNAGIVRVEKFKIGENTIAFGSSVPGYAGKPGDVVFNTSMNTADGVFGWLCIQNFSWIPLKTA